MQHVKKQWLSLFAYVLVGLDALLFAVYFLFENLGVNQNIKDHWGITGLILGIAAAHTIYIATIFQILRKKLEWLATIISIILFAMLFAAIIDTSGNTNLVYRLGYAVLVFFMGMNGPFAPIATVTLTWLVMIFTYSSVLTPSSASLGFNIVINTIVTVAAFLGWLFFKRFYEKNKDAEAIALSKLLEQEQFKTTAMLESISDGVMVINTKGTVQVLNESAATMLGWTKSEALKLDYRSLLKPIEGGEQNSANQAATEVIQRTFESHKSEQNVVLLHTKNGRQLYVDIVASPILETLDSKGSTDEEATAQKQLVGVIAVLRDVDEQKRQEQQRSDFISTASHEMRTPVASIQGFIELALNPKVAQVDEKAKGYLLKAQDATKHLGELFQDLLTVSKSDDGRLNNTPEIIEVVALLQELTDQGRMNAEKKGLKVTFEATNGSQKTVSPLMYIHADPDRLREVINNLFDNAIKYTPSGIITVGASLKEQSVVMRISDTGMGIAAEDIPHLFQKFYRTDNSATREIGGTGLGLYICRQIVEMMGGRIWVESTLGAGSTFFVELPRVSPESKTPTKP